MMSMMLASTLAAALLAHQPPERALPQVPTLVNRTVELVTLSAKESHLGKGRHVALAVSAAGDVAGAVLTPRGRAVCEFIGFYDTGSRCLTLSGCGLDRTACA
jgi:hypothetical protein